jgi:N-acetylgalactosamine-N,N'-diacetylbacillosaminyl-diphospho-undecaprenol 4-alpha-N-acetylgalactosaminyltransferase
LFVINSLAGGGAERVFTTIVRHSEAMRSYGGISVALLDTETHEAYVLPDWINVVRLDCKGSLLRSILRLSALVRRLRPSVTLSFLTRANVAAILARRWTRDRVVISERVNTTAHLATGRMAMVSRALVRWTYPCADRIIAVSDGVRQTLIDDFAVAPERAVVIHNPVDVDAIRLLGAAPDSVGATSADWVTMGRLVANKNTALAIRAFAESGLPGRLFVLGDGPMRTELADLARKKGVSDRVIFAGFLSNPYAVIARCRAFILPSNAEGFPNAMVEAMALGVPALATDCPSGPAEILEATVEGNEPATGRGGLLVRLGDSAMLAQAMGAVMDDAMRTTLSIQAARRVEDYGIEKTVNLFWDAMLAGAPEGKRELP